MTDLLAALLAISLYLGCTVLLLMKLKKSGSVAGMSKSMILIPGFLGLVLVQETVLYRKYDRMMPPLTTMESLLFDAIIIGFVCLSVSLVSGMVFLEDMFAQHLAHKTVLSIIAWLVFAILLTGRWMVGWRGRTAIRWTLGGFISLMLAYFGSKFVLELILATS